MKTTTLLGLTTIGLATAFAPKAQAGGSFHLAIGLPLPPPPAVVVSTQAIRCEPPVVVYQPPVCPPAVVVAPSAPRVVYVTPDYRWYRDTRYFTYHDSRHHHGHDSHWYHSDGRSHSHCD
jgi:hypothetical protein